MHDTFRIEGGYPLSGSIAVMGAKNEALKVMAATLLSDKPCLITNLPKIEDVHRMAEILTAIGVVVKESDAGTEISPASLTTTSLPPKLVNRIRASVMLVGPLLARHGEVVFPHPGGCQIGQRPIDIFLEGFRALGANVEDLGEAYRFSAKRLTGSTIVFRRVSVTATEAMMMTATLAQGTTILKNAAMEPEIPALADYLNAHGARISGAGTSTITIEGVDELSAGPITLIPDRAEAGTFAILGLITNSDLTITGVEPAHLENLWLHLEKAGANIEINGSTVRTTKHNGLKATNITTHEYPGFITDLQAPYTILMTQANGLSLIHETIFEGRLFYTDLLNSMGANIIMCDPHRVVVNGPTKLRGRYLTSPDLRAGMALILAGLVADGTTTIDNAYQVDRGYERIVERLQALGARIERVESPH